MLTGWIPMLFKVAIFLKSKKLLTGFNQNADVVATLASSPLDNFCASAISPNKDLLFFHNIEFS